MTPPPPPDPRHPGGERDVRQHVGGHVNDHGDRPGHPQPLPRYPSQPPGDHERLGRQAGGLRAISYCISYLIVGVIVVVSLGLGPLGPAILNIVIRRSIRHGWVGLADGIADTVSDVGAAAIMVVSALADLVRQPGAGMRAGTESSTDHLYVPLKWWRVLCVMSWLMPREAGRRWLMETESMAFETPEDRRREALRSLARSAPEAALVMWWDVLSRWGRG